MKRVLFILFAVLLTTQVMAQKSRLRKNYVNLNFSTVTMTQGDSPTLKSNYGAAFTIGKTYFVHKKPIAKMIRFGIDATWFDINYNNYKVEYRYQDRGEYKSEFSAFHQAEIGVQVGPSITVNPISKLNIHGYFRYAPSFSAFYDGDALRGGYVGYFVGGGAVSYGVIGLGIEARFGACKYKTFGGDGKDAELDIENTTVTPKSKFSGMRVYLTFRF